MRAVAALLVALALVLAAAPAYANDKRAASAAFQRGRSLYDAGQYAEALAAFKEGHDAYPLPGFLVNIGQCQRKLDRLDDAESAFQQFLASDSTDERTRAEVHEALDQIAAEHTRRDAEEQARRQRDELAARRAPVADTDARPDLRVHAAAIAVPAAAVAAPVMVMAPEVRSAKPKRSKKWVWAVVTVLAAGAAAAAVTVGVLETQQPPPRPGSLGLLDGRR